MKKKLIIKKKKIEKKYSLKKKNRIKIFIKFFFNILKQIFKKISF
jgi:hypothetical protein